jgi:hypothetical protein
MTAGHDNRSPGGARVKSAASPWPPLAVAALAVVARLPALGAWWNQDDWGLLARAAGLIEAHGPPLRYLSRDLYWQLLHPLAGLDPAPYAFTRLLLHALAAAAVVRLGARLGLSALQGWTAGLIMAASPLAFTALYWGAGVQDLLAVACAVWALERWLAPGRTAAAVAALLAIAALAAKELVGLPLLLALFGLAAKEQRPLPRERWLLIALLTAAAVAAGLLALRGFATGSGQPYALGAADTVARNLLSYGWWLLLPGPHFPPASGAAAAAGAALWLVWAAWGAVAWRRGRRVPLLALAGALLMLAPVLPLVRHVSPELAYPAEAFGCLALGCLVPRRWPARQAVVAVLAMVAVAWGFGGMRARLNLRDANGRLADPVVRRTALSWQACRELRSLPVPEAGLVILQPPLVPATAAMAAKLGEERVQASPLYHSLDGALGPRLVLQPPRPVVWANGLRRTPAEALVLLDAGDTLKPWGPTPQALLDQVLTDVGLGFFERARLHLLRASLLAGDTLTIIFDPDLLPVSLEQVLANEDAFLEYLEAGRRTGRSAQEIAGLQQNFLRLLSVCTGREMESPPAPDRPGAASSGETEEP